MNYRFIGHRFILIAILIASIVQTGCKEHALINSKVSPSGARLGVYDTYLDCITHTKYDDTVLTSLNIGGLSIYQAVGTLTDPFFGTMTGATYFQVIPTSFNGSAYDNTDIDSVVLNLPYSGFTYGDTLNHSITQSYQVFYVPAGLAYDSAYYAYNTRSVDEGTPLSAATSVNLYQLNDTFSVSGVTYRKGLRIKLNTQAFMNRLAPAQAILTTSGSPATDFINLFRGLCVRVANPLQTNTAIPYFRLDGVNVLDQAGVTVYYHHNNVSTPDTLTSYYTFSTTYCAHFNGITNAYTGTPVNGLYNSTQANDSIAGIQNQPGAALDVIIPHISSLPKGVIMKAQLQLSILPWYGVASLPSPNRIYPLGIGNGVYPVGVYAGGAYNVADRYPLTSLSPLTVMDGYIHPVEKNGKTVYVYTIDIPREVMSSLSANNDNIHLHINGTQDLYGAFRMVIGGGTNADTTYRPKLFVVYSMLNK